MDDRENNGSPMPLGGQPDPSRAPSASEPSEPPPAIDAATEDKPVDPDNAVPPTLMVPPEAPVIEPRIRLEKKHPLAIRWMHWVNFPVSSP